MRAGTLDSRVALQRRTTTLSSSGSPSDSWTTLAEVWAAVDPLTGDERSAAEQWIAREQVRFTIRWSEDVQDLSPLDRIVFPFSDAASSPAPTRSIYDVMVVNDRGRRDSMIVLAARRAG